MRSWPITALLLSLNAAADGRVVIDMPAPRGAPAAAAASPADRAAGRSSPGATALPRYAWARSGPLYVRYSWPRPWGYGYGYAFPFGLYPCGGFPFVAPSLRRSVAFRSPCP